MVRGRIREPHISSETIQHQSSYDRHLQPKEANSRSRWVFSKDPRGQIRAIKHSGVLVWREGKEFAETGRLSARPTVY